MKPVWLNKKISLQSCMQMKTFLRDSGVETVCEQAMCPNIGECFSRKQATFLILGKHCTRMCSFCNIKKNTPVAVDVSEPENISHAVEKLLLKHVVITSVTRDDLLDGGASFFCDTIFSIRRRTPKVTVEVLIPDFKLSRDAIKAVVEASPDILAHNVEVVPSLYPLVRQGAQYRRSLDVLRVAKEISAGLKTKSGIMLGLGEQEQEVIEVMRDLRSVGCDFLSIGQYLAPSNSHFPVKEYVAPGVFDYFKQQGKELGFLHVASGPYVRSSYLADEYLSGASGDKLLYNKV